jgi:nicotinate-nucleotide adenylyltransferase
MAGRRIGLLGGSFDPVHVAHIALADAALPRLQLDEVQLIPAADPWQREPLSATPQQRLDMLAIATRGRPRLVVNPIEIKRAGKTYTIDTLQALPEGPVYYWILGADQLENFCTWRRWKDIANLATLAVAQRPGSSVAAPDALQRHLDGLGRQLVRLPFEPMHVSASEIRERLANRQPADGLLDPAVSQYIEENDLYHPHSA